MNRKAVFLAFILGGLLIFVVILLVMRRLS